MNDKDTQTISLKDAETQTVITEQPKSYGSINDPSKAVIPIEAQAKTNVKDSCNNCACCTFSFVSNNYAPIPE